MTDEHITLTESGAWKARAVHRLPPEEKFAAQELTNVRGRLRHGAAESLQAPIVTQQDQSTPVALELALLLRSPLSSFSRVLASPASISSTALGSS